MFVQMPVPSLIEQDAGQDRLDQRQAAHARGKSRRGGDAERDGATIGVADEMDRPLQRGKTVVQKFDFVGQRRCCVRRQCVVAIARRCRAQARDDGDRAPPPAAPTAALNRANNAGQRRSFARARSTYRIWPNNSSVTPVSKSEVVHHLGVGETLDLVAVDADLRQGAIVERMQRNDQPTDPQRLRALGLGCRGAQEMPESISVFLDVACMCISSFRSGDRTVLRVTGQQVTIVYATMRHHLVRKVQRGN